MLDRELARRPPRWAEICVYLDAAPPELVSSRIAEAESAAAALPDEQRTVFGAARHEEAPPARWLARIADGHDEPRFALARSIDVWDGGRHYGEQEERLQEHLKLVARAAVRAPMALSHIRHATFRNAQQTDSVVPIVAALSNLETLDLSRSQLVDALVVPLPTLRSLDLAATELSPERLLELITGPVIDSVEHLDLSHNPLGDAGLRLFAEARLPRLRHLDLTATGCTSRGACALATASGLAGLEILHLTRNDIDTLGVKALRDSPLGQRLRVLNLARGSTVSEQSTEGARRLWESYDAERRRRGERQGFAAARAVLDSAGATRETYSALRAHYYEAFFDPEIDSQLVPHWPTAGANPARSWATPPDSLIPHLLELFEHERHPMDDGLVVRVAAKQPELAIVALTTLLHGSDTIGALRAALALAQVAAPSMLPLLQRGLDHASLLVKVVCALGIEHWSRKQGSAPAPAPTLNALMDRARSVAVGGAVSKS